MKPIGLDTSRFLLITLLLLLFLTSSRASAQIKTDQTFHLPRLSVYDSLDRRLGQVMSIVRGVGGGWQPVVLLTVGSSGVDCLVPVAVRRNNLSTGVPSYYTSTNCTGTPHVDPAIESSISTGFWGPPSCGFHVINSNNVLYRFVPPQIAPHTSIYSQMGADGVCSQIFLAFPVVVGAPIQNLTLSFTPPFRLY